jgi:hypothetical protein
LPLVDAASVDALGEDPAVRNILCTVGIRRASLWYASAHVASDAPGEQKIAGRWCKHEAEVYRSLVGERAPAVSVRASQSVLMLQLPGLVS